MGGIVFQELFQFAEAEPRVVGQERVERELEKLCRVLPPALMAAMPVGANTTCFFRVWLQIYFSKVDLPVPALPVRKTELRVNCMSFSVLWNSGF